MTFHKRLAGTLLALLTAVLLLPGQARAAGTIDLQRPCGLNLAYRDGQTPLVGQIFSIYLTATVDEVGELTVTEDFAQFNVNIRGKNDEAWKTLASTLEGYVLRDRITPTDVGSTNQWGELSFPSEGKTLTPGLYLVLGSRHIQDGVVYDSQPFMTVLPTMDKEADDWEYLVEASPKFNSHGEPEDGDTVDRRVLKIWQDEGHELERPNTVTAQLLKDGVLVDSVTLSAANGWGYTWENLDSSSQWLVTEAASGDYTVEIFREGATLVMVNSSTTDIPDEPVPESPGEPDEPDNPDNPDKPDEPDKPDNPEEPDDEFDIPDEDVPLASLPQTGQLWWPVPLLLCGGLTMIVLGLLRRRGV